MEELFLSSAQGDSSLALPAEPARRSATKVGPKERSVRVQQQGSDLGIVNLSFSSSQVRKPSRRVEVSPPVTPGFACFSGNREVTCVPATFRELPRKAAAVFELCPAEREVWIPEEFQTRRRLSRQKPGLVGSGPEGAPRPPHDGAAASFVPWRGDGWVDPAGGTKRTPAPHPGGPPKEVGESAEMTVERAVSLLSNGDEDTLLRAAGHIQTCCFRSADTKKTVYFLRGIEKLVRLLRSDSESVQRVAAGALRNVVYQSGENKMEVKEKGGLGAILQALRSSRDVETRRELTGLLWNLSSHDLLKEPLSAEVVSVLTKSVLVPTSGISEGENPKDDLLADDVAFHNATGCLRNLSSAGPDSRKAMKECEDLIDSLVYYVRGAIADYKTDDGSTENCVCILHNLSYRLEDELPETNVRVLRESRQNLANRPRAVGCFAHRGTKITEHVEEQCPLLEEKSNPQGTEWLWSTITVRMYLSLLARSVRHRTQEAALGALQNITAGNGPLSEALAFSVVQRENGLQQVRKMLEDGEGDVKRTAVALVKNTCRFQELHPVIVKQVLPELVWMLPGDDGPADATAVSVCLILNHLSLSDRQHVGAIVKEGALPRIVGISRRDGRNGPSRAGQAARVLLHTMWKYSDLHGTYRKFGFRKADFIHTRNTKIVCT
eukprot:XP_011611757.1 PREDICTED: plakophilin-2 [Takifugu rubripes]